MPLSAGDKFGPYTILAPLGAGGMGEVYKARDTQLDRDVAIKVLPAALARDPERLARFEREAKVLASLNHPNIATIHRVEEADGIRALVMELVPGETLQGPLPLETALRYAKQVAEALEAAHEKGIVHRDLKPANIMVTPAGVVKVLDFGLAAVTQPSAAHEGHASQSPTLTMRATQEGMILGTAGYMAPEQAAGQPLDKRADIWAFGVVLYEMLSGQRLFTGDSIAHILADVLRAPIDFDKLPRETPRAIRDLVKRCLERDVKKRLRDIGEARVAIENLGAEPDVAATIAAPSRRGLAAGIAAGLLLLTTLGVSLVHFRETPVDRPLMRLSVDLGPDAVAGLRSTAVLSPDGTRIVFPIRGPNGTTQLATRTLDQPKAAPLLGTEGGSDPFFSPDGQWIGFFAGGKLKKIAAQGGAAVTLSEAVNPKGGSWSEDGSIYFCPLNQSPLMRIPAAGGVPSPVTKLAEGETSHRSPQVLPGGKAVLFTSFPAGNSENAYIAVLSLKTGEVKMVQRGGHFGRFMPSPQGGGYLLYVHESTFFAVPFDPDRLETRGAPVPLLDDVAGDPGQASGEFDGSQSGSLVYQSGRAGNSYPILWMDSEGKTTPLLAKPNTYGALRFSPDGRRLAFTAPGSKGTEVWVYDWERDTPAQLTFTGPANLEMAWTPDGKHIAFSSRSDSITALWWVRSDGSGEPRKLFEMKSAGPGLRPQSFTPDGRRLAFDFPVVIGNADVYTLPLDVSDPDHPKPGKPEAFLTSPVREVDPAFSPDGHWIAYASNESGVEEVFVRSFPGPGGKWKISTASGKFPTWSRNGRELFYLGADNRIMVADYTARGESFSASKPRVWSDRRVLRPSVIRVLDLHPDGKRFAVLAQPDAEKETGNLHVTFLLNFADELRRRVPVSK